MIQFLSNIALMGAVQIITLGGFFTGVYYFTFYNDGSLVKKQTAEVHTQIKAVDQKISKQKDEITRLVNYKKAVEKEARAIQYFLSYIPNEYTAIDVFHFLTREAKNAGINIEDKADQGMQDGEFYNALKVHVRVAGSFSQVLLFLSRLTAQKKILVVNDINLSISSGEDDQWISASMTVYAYRYREEEEKEDEKKEG
ncbi:MAG: type 4a pilus biogenesis protein PilO [Bdellovibrionales bacterium]|nr:type 4a pilus biogenesis protein PilO [Bdellovibrionales bacterium]